MPRSAGSLDHMRCAGLGLSFALLFGLGLPAWSAKSSFSGVGRSIDGDSLYVGDREVRLYGIDAPEYRQTCTLGGKQWSCGVASAKQLSSIVTGKLVRCEQVDMDEHGRIVARCAVGSVDVNRMMVLTGYATAYRHYSRQYAPAEQVARANRRGIWASTFETPRDFRLDERAEGPRGAPTPRYARGQNRSHADTHGGCNIKGNRGAHGWIYHVPGMPYYEQTHAEEWFCTESAAQAAGYRRARAY